MLEEYVANTVNLYNDDVQEAFGRNIDKAVGLAASIGTPKLGVSLER